MRALLAVAVAAAAVGFGAPQAHATRCSADIVTCTIRCAEAYLHGDLC